MINLLAPKRVSLELVITGGQWHTTEAPQAAIPAYLIHDLPGNMMKDMKHIGNAWGQQPHGCSAFGAQQNHCNRCRGSLAVSRLQDNSGSSDLKFGSGNTWSRMGTFQNMIDITSFSNQKKR